MRSARSPFPQHQQLIIQGVPDLEADSWTGQRQPLVRSRDDSALPGVLRPTYIYGIPPSEDNGVGVREPVPSQRLPPRGFSNPPNRKRAPIRGGTKSLGKDSGPDSMDKAQFLLDDEMGECLEEILQSRFFDLSVMSFNLNFYSNWPRDAEGAYNKMVEIIENQPTPDVICVQEGLTGLDVFNELGYLLVRSSSSCSQPLNQALYNNADFLNDVDDDSCRRFLVNEIYVKGDGTAKTSWEIVDHGAEPISKDEQRFVARSVVWVKLRHRARPQGPFVFVFNTQLSGGPLEEKLFAQEAIRKQRREQIEYVLRLVESIDRADLVLLVGELGAMLSEGKQESHFRLLEERGWKFAYGQDQVGPTSSHGQLVDHMATNQSIPAQVKVFPTTNQRGELPVTQVPLSDHNAVKATFSIRYDANETDKMEDSSPSPAQAEERHRSRLLSPPIVRPDPYDMSYNSQCARYECEYHDLMEERNLEQQSMEDITTELSERMWQLRNECSDQLHANSHITQLMQNAHTVLTIGNDSWASKHAALQDELQDAEFQRERIESEMENEAAEIQTQIEASEKQQEDMESSRRALGRHLDSMDRSIETFKHDIVEERKMTKEIREAGDQNLKEKSERYTREAEYLQDALRHFEEDHAQFISDTEQEFLRGRDDLKVIESELAEARQLVEKESTDFKVQFENLKFECVEKDEELTENEARIQAEADEFRLFDEPRDSVREAFEASREEQRRFNDRSSGVQTEISGLTKEIDLLEERINDFRHLWPESWDKRPGKLVEEVKQLDESLANLGDELESEEERGERLQALLEEATRRRGICACFCPGPKPKQQLGDVRQR